MLLLMKSEWKKVYLPVLTTMLLLAVISCVLSCTTYQNYLLHYDLEAWEIGTAIFNLLFPLFVVIPLCWNLYYERKDNFLLYVLPRVSEKKYLLTKWLVYALSAFFILLIPYLLSAIFALYIKSPIPVYIPHKGETPFSHVFLTTFTQNPLLYAVILSCWKGFIGILIMSFGFVLSMYVNNIFVILTGPFVYTILVDFIFAILRLEKYQLVVAFEPTCISDNAVTNTSFFVGPIMLLIIIFLTVFFLKKIKKNTIMTI